MRNLTRVSALTAVVVLAAPLIANAQDVHTITALLSFLINFGIGLMIALAVLVLFYGIVRYIGGGQEAKASGMTIMLYGIIGIFVMLSIYGLVLLLQHSFGINSNTQITPPTVPLLK